MRNLASKVKNARLRKLPVLLALVAALVVPGVIRAYAEDNPTPAEDEALVVANLNEGGELETEAPVTEAPVEEPAPEPEPTDEEPPVTEEEQVVEDVEDEGITNDETEEDPVEESETPAEALQRYIDFATAEHPGVEISEVKFVWKNGVKSAKIIFEDGWKVYIGVSNGDTLSVVDNRNKVHRCQRRMKHAKSYAKWYKHYRSYYQWWMAQQNNGDDDSEEDSDSEVQSIRDTNKRNTKARGTQHYTDTRYNRHHRR